MDRKLYACDRTMSRSATMFIAGCLLGLLLAVWAFVALVLAVGRDHVVTETWFPDVLKMKRYLSERTPSPRVILAAGSGTMFGVDSGVLGASIGLPVVNMALHASLPFEFYCEEMRRQAREGDTVVMPLEMPSFYEGTIRGRICSDFPLSVLFGIAPEYSRAFSPATLAFVYAHYGLEWICRNLRGQTHCADTPLSELERRWRMEHASRVYQGYSFEGMTEHGDMLVRRPSLPLSDKKWKLPASLSPTFVTSWRTFSEEMKRRGVRVVLTWGSLLWYPDRAGFEDMREMLAREGIALHGRPEAFSFPAACYYDSQYHLNAYGASLNAVSLARVLAPVLGRPLNLPPSAPAHVVFAEDYGSVFPGATNLTAYASGVRLAPGVASLHAAIPSDSRGKVAHLDFILEKSSAVGIKDVTCCGVPIPVRRIDHEFRDEVVMTVPKRLTDADVLDLTLTLADGVGFERMTWLEPAPDVRYCSGFAGEWTIGNRAEVELDIPEGLRGRDAVVRLSIRPSEEKLSVFCGDTPLGQYDLTWDAVELKVPVSSRLTDGDTLRIRLELDRVKSPKERGWSADDRKLGPRIVSIGLQDNNTR